MSHTRARYRRGPLTAGGATRPILSAILSLALCATFLSGFTPRSPIRAAASSTPATREGETVVVTLHPVEVATIAEGSPTLSSGGATIGWSHRMHEGRRRALARFDLTGLPADVQLLEARLVAGIVDWSGLARLDALASPLAAGWSAGRVAWENQPAAAPGAVRARLGTSGVARWDITDFARAWLVQPAANHGLLLDSLADYPEVNQRRLANLQLELTLRRPDTQPAAVAQASCERVRNGDFELFTDYWESAGEMPSSIVSPGRDSMFALQLGGSAFTADPGSSTAWQVVRLPADATAAPLTFHYQVATQAGEAPYDGFEVLLFDAEGQRLETILKDGSDSGGQWLERSYDLSHYVGQSVILSFSVHNDGNAAQTSAYLDDVSLCVQRPADPEPTPTPYADTCALQANLPDYAPHGLPDFSARQQTWSSGSPPVSTYDGPVALADILWWLDSRFEPASTPPPDSSDNFGLLRSYGAWDDHAAENVVPLVEDLAYRVDTDGQRTAASHTGTLPQDLAAGLQSYLQAVGLERQFEVALLDQPAFDTVRHHVTGGDGVALLVGFFQWGAAGWQRLGGRYLAVEAVGCESPFLTVSDPLRDSAERGRPGMILPFPEHEHAFSPPDPVHNDAAYVSHDRYPIALMDDGWGLSGYVLDVGDMSQSLGANGSTDTTGARAALPVAARVEYALVLSRLPATVSLAVSPRFVSSLGPAPFRVDLVARSDDELITRCDIFLQYDPAAFQAVDAAGQPAVRIEAGSTLPSVDANQVHASVGRIHFAAHTAGSGRAGSQTLATVRFRPLTNGITRPLALLGEPGATTELWAGPAPVLGQALPGKIVVEPASALHIQLDLEGRPPKPASSWAIPTLLTLHKAGSAAPWGLFSAGANGSGVIDLDAPTPIGTWVVSGRGAHTLPGSQPEAHLISGDTSLALPRLTEGDANADNQVAVQDVSLLVTSFSAHRGDPAFDGRTDLNEDGVVNSADLTLLTGNLGRESGLSLGRLSTTMGAGAGSVTLTALPSMTKTYVGSAFPVTLQAQGFAQGMDAIELHLSFDPTLLQVVDADGTPAANIVPSGTFNTVLMNAVDNEAGRIDYVAAQVEGTPPTGFVDVAFLSMKATAPSAETWVRFAADAPRRSSVAYRGNSILRGYSALKVSGQTRAYVPLIRK